VLKLARRYPDFRRRLLDLTSDEAFRDDRMAQLLIYMLKVYADLDRETLGVLTARLSEEERREVTTLAERLFAEGKAEGLQEGQALGLQKGEALGLRKAKAEALMQILELRFGPVPAAVRHRVEDADSDVIDAWLRRAIEAASLEQVTDPERG
jgi:predicted transposase YdaD